MARKLEWACERHKDGYIEYRTSDGEWLIDNCINKPPLVDDDDWNEWNLYMVAGQEKEYIGDFHTVREAKKEAQDIVKRDEHG